MRDFTLAMYSRLCNEIKRSSYVPVTVEQYCRGLGNSHKRFIIMRHDIDRKPDRALKMAYTEKKNGIISTYYFRVTRDVFDPHMIDQIASLGHEIGYHYEVLDKANGDKQAAIKIFRRELEMLRQMAPINTVCMHGNPLKPWSNRDLWETYDYKDFDIIGEPYISINYQEVYYLTDTGRKWNSRVRIKDVVDTSVNLQAEKIQNTHDIIKCINDQSVGKMCILTHPNRWNDDLNAWLTEFFMQNFKNIGKAGILWYRKSKTPSWNGASEKNEKI